MSQSWGCVRSWIPAATIVVGQLCSAWWLAVPTAVGDETVAQANSPVKARVEVTRDVAYGPHGPRNTLDLFLPESTGSSAGALRPLVICIHGGGWAGGDKEGYEWLARSLAEQGFAAASITYRFAPDWHAPTQMDDVQRAVRWLRKNAAKYNIDPDRFGAIGGSAGGHLASFIALAETRDNSDAELQGISSRVQCAVDCYGPVDLVAMMSSASAPIVEQFVGKQLAGHEEAYRRASATSHVGKNPPPFLILHGTRDIGRSIGEVPMEQSVDFCAQLREAGGDATLIKLEGAGHGFSHQASGEYAQTTLRAASEFFARHLKPASK